MENYFPKRYLFNRIQMVLTHDMKVVIIILQVIVTVFINKQERRKRMKKVKKIFAVVMVLTLICSSFVFAKTSNQDNNLNITNAYVKGSGYKSLTTGKKTKSNKTLSVLVTRMLKDDGDSSDYRYSWWQVVNLSDGITLNSGVKVTKGTSYSIPLYRKTTTKKNLSVSVKGNMNDLDTIINATIFNFNK